MLNTLFNRRNVRATVWGLCCLLAVAVLQPEAIAKDKGPIKFKPFKLETMDGTRKTLADVTGKVTLVGFFFPQCPFCKVSLPEVQKIYEKYKEQGLSVVWINVVPQEKKLIPSWIERFKITAPVLVGASQASLMRDYDLKATPTHYLLGAQGEVLLYQNGYTVGDEKVLEAKIVEALNIVH